MTEEIRNILHVCCRAMILPLRDEVLRLQGYQVVSTLSAQEAVSIARERDFSLVLVDVEGEGRVPQAEELCSDIRALRPKQKVAFVCNHRVHIHSDCPDEVLRAQFNPQELVRGVKQLLEPDPK